MQFVSDIKTDEKDGNQSKARLGIVKEGDQGKQTVTRSIASASPEGFRSSASQPCKASLKIANISSLGINAFGYERK